MPTTHYIINNVSSSSDSISPPENTFFSPKRNNRKCYRPLRIFRCEFFAMEIAFLGCKNLETIEQLT